MPEPSRLVIGVDLKKDLGTLLAAYNDAAGVTAAFNLNILARINRELGAAIDLTRFRHDAFYNAREGRIEMHLVSRVRPGRVDLRPAHSGSQRVSASTRRTPTSTRSASSRTSPRRLAGLPGVSGPTIRPFQRPRIGVKKGRDSCVAALRLLLRSVRT